MATVGEIAQTLRAPSNSSTIPSLDQSYNASVANRFSLVPSNVISGVQNYSTLRSNSLSSNSADAYSLENRSVQDMLRWQEQQNQKAMDFSAKEALLNREFQQHSADIAWQRSQEAAQVDRDWQKMMSDTAYTRVVQDLRNAGLNPILAYTNGAASAGSGSTATSYQASGAQGTGYTSSGYKADYNQAARNAAEAKLAEIKTALEGFNTAAKLISSFI